MSFLWLHIFITKYIGQYLKRVKRVGRTLSQEIFKKFWNNFDFVPPMIHDTKAIIWRISFIANIFEWTENPSLLEVSVRHENG